ncbi:MAG: heme exporter protein CcmB [Gemmatimonadales bacterium]|nr:heme exporter protein CcmB [Gemmatimonadales bacterium]
MLSAALTLAAKDLRAELRSRSALMSALLLACLVLFVLYFARDPTAVAPALVAPGALWVTAAFAATTALNRAFQHEKEHGAIDGLLLAPIAREAIFLGKYLANVAFTLAIELLAVPLVVLFFNVDFGPVLGGMALLLPLTTLGFAAVGTVFGAITARAKHAELLLPTLVMPFLVIPVVVGVQVTGRLLGGQTLAEVAGWLRLLCVYDVIFIVLCLLVFPVVVRD